MRPERLAELGAARHAIPIDGEVREQQAPLPAGQFALDPSTPYAGDEGPAELDPRLASWWLPFGHFAKLAPKASSDDRARKRANEKEATMAYVITCDCGYVVRGETEEQLVEDLNRHVKEVHPDLVGSISEEDALAMAEEV